MMDTDNSRDAIATCASSVMQPVSGSRLVLHKVQCVNHVKAESARPFVMMNKVYAALECDP
jgi:hypothetical protein